MKIFSQSKLQLDTEFVTRVLQDNGYSLDMCNLAFMQFNKTKLFGPEKCPIYICNFHGLVSLALDLLSKSLEVGNFAIFLLIYK